MNENEERIRKLLRSAIAPLENPELARDSWPEMLRRLDDLAGLGPGGARIGLVRYLPGSNSGPALSAIRELLS